MTVDALLSLSVCRHVQTITVHNTEASLHGIKIRTCDEDEYVVNLEAGIVCKGKCFFVDFLCVLSVTRCSDGGHHYIDCPMHLPQGTSKVFVDDDLYVAIGFFRGVWLG